MTQYCRYCANLAVGDAVWCEAKEREMSEASAKCPNKCKRFVFNEIDAFDPSRSYSPKPKIPAKPKNWKQSSVFDFTSCAVNTSKFREESPSYNGTERENQKQN